MGGRIDVYVDIGASWQQPALPPLHWPGFPLTDARPPTKVSLYSYLGFVLLRRDLPLYAANGIEVVYVVSLRLAFRAPI